jgi:hypothetical protein
VIAIGMLVGSNLQFQSDSSCPPTSLSFAEFVCSSLECLLHQKKVPYFICFVFIFLYSLSSKLYADKKDIKVEKMIMLLGRMGMASRVPGSQCTRKWPGQ